jgi:hypothetical protein
LRENNGWWNMGIWRLKRVRGNFNQEISPVCGKLEGKSHVLRCEQTRNWRDGLLERIGIRKNWTVCIRYQVKWKRLVKKSDDRWK